MEFTKSDKGHIARISVLIVDDELDVVEEIAAGLSGRGFDVSFTTDPRSALQRMRSRSGPLVLVTDVRMPVMSGIELARTALAERPESGVLGVVFISGHSSEAMIRDGFANEPVFYLRKPFTLAEIGAAIRQVAATAHARPH